MKVVSTRPEIIKLSQVMKELDKFTDHIIVHTGSFFKTPAVITVNLPS